MTCDELKAIMERAEKASAGPWLRNSTQNKVDGLGICEMSPPWHPDHVSVVASAAKNSHGRQHRDADFIAHARQDIPALLAHVAYLQKRTDLQERLIAACRDAKYVMGALALRAELADLEQKNR